MCDVCTQYLCAHAHKNCKNTCYVDYWMKVWTLKKYTNKRRGLVSYLKRNTVCASEKNTSGGDILEAFIQQLNLNVSWVSVLLFNSSYVLFRLWYTFVELNEGATIKEKERQKAERYTYSGSRNSVTIRNWWTIWMQGELFVSLRAPPRISLSPHSINVLMLFLSMSELVLKPCE